MYHVLVCSFSICTMVGLERTPRLYLGTMTFAWSQTSSRVDDTIASEMLRLFAETTTAPRIDTARIYAGGKTEGCVGTALSMNQGGAVFSVGTKAHPSQPGGLSRSGIQTQFEKSKEVLQAKANTPVAFGEYYLHQPDTCLLYTSPSPRDQRGSRMPSSA